MKKIIVINHNQNSSKSASIFALNLASNIVNISKKVLVFSTVLSPEYFKDLKPEIVVSKSTKQIPPFKIYSYKYKLNFLFFGADTDQNIKIKSISEVLRLLKRQLDLIQLNYDYLKDNSYKLKEGDTFSIRKIGKFKYNGIIKYTKSNHIIVEILKYL